MQRLLAILAAAQDPVSVPMMSPRNFWGRKVLGTWRPMDNRGPLFCDYIQKKMPERAPSRVKAQHWGLGSGSEPPVMELPLFQPPFQLTANIESALSLSLNHTHTHTLVGQRADRSGPPPPQLCPPRPCLVCYLCKAAILTPFPASGSGDCSSEVTGSNSPFLRGGLCDDRSTAGRSTCPVATATPALERWPGCAPTNKPTVSHATHALPCAEGSAGSE